MVRSIVVGADGSLAARAALLWALERARALSAAVQVVLVVDDEWGTVGRSAMAELTRSGRETLDAEIEFCRGRSDGVRVSGAMLVGHPMAELAECSAGGALVVVGTHKTEYFRGRTLGSRSLQLAGSARVPCVIVPAGEVRTRYGIAVGVGAGPAGLDAVRFAAAEAVRTGERLTLIRVDDRADIPVRDELVDEAMHAAEGMGAIVAPQIRRSSGTAVDALISASEYSLLTVVGRSGSPVAPLARTTISLLLHLGGPVVIVPAQQEA